MSRTNSIADHSPLFVDFHPGGAAYLAGPFADTGALFRLDALAISQNLIDVFFLLVLLKFERRAMHAAWLLPTANKRQVVDKAARGMERLEADLAKGPIQAVSRYTIIEATRPG